MRTWQLAALAALAILATGKIVGAAGLIDTPPPGPPAGFEVCVNAQRELDLCPIPGYKPPHLLIPGPYLYVPRSPEERRHQEMLDAIRDLKR